MIDPATFMTTQEVADRLKVNDAFVLNIIKSGQLEAYQIGRGYRISEEALQRYLESTRVEVK